ncbi:SH2 domain-containing protein 1B isoform X2 [Petaurus breviceps papuanus]|uniref:SH2 domain-containing protein 1B isoform X2 n=1 Tax=Petaurus breviceps papuanus TaxID=3040969 RepID=UPI0036DC7B6C
MNSELRALMKHEIALFSSKNLISSNPFPRVGENFFLNSRGIRFQNKIYTYRIRKEKYGYYTIETEENIKKVLFPNIKELISKFEKPNQGLVVHLRYPVEKNNIYQSDRSPPTPAAWEEDYVNVDREDYVEVLP